MIFKIWIKFTLCAGVEPFFIGTVSRFCQKTRVGAESGVLSLYVLFREITMFCSLLGRFSTGAKQELSSAFLPKQKAEVKIFEARVESESKNL